MHGLLHYVFQGVNMIVDINDLHAVCDLRHNACQNKYR